MSNSYEEGFEKSKGDISSFFTKIYALMFLGLLITFGVTYGLYYGAVSGSVMAYDVINFVLQFYYIILIAEVLVVIFLNARLMKMSKYAALTMFIVYSLLNGLTFSIILPFYTNVGLALGMASITFLVMTVYGFVTKSDLSNIGGILTVGLISVIIATVVNMFLRNEMLDYIICYAGLFIFIALTAYDTNKLKMIYNSRGEMDDASITKLAIIGALKLYLDFINMFMYILRLLNRNR